MVEQFLRQSPLAHLGLGGQAQDEIGEAGIAMAERPFPAIVDLRGDPKVLSEPVKKALGVDLPVEANTTASEGALTALCLGPNQWWLIRNDGTVLAGELTTVLHGQAHAATNIGESRACIRVSGPRARDLLAKGCPLDLHPSGFPEGACAQTLLAKAGVLIHNIEGQEAYDLYVLRSFADYLWHWLADAAREYGLAILSE